MMRSILYSLLLLVFLMSCDREDVSFQGPETQVASDNFQVTTPLAASDNNVDFSSEAPVNFSATFNESVSYTIIITGQTSGAEKRITGSGSLVNDTWVGDAISTFFETEVCNVELRVLGKSEVIGTTSVTISGVMDAPGNLVANFEPGGTNGLLGFWEADVNGKATRIACERTDEVSIEGDYSFLLKGENHLNTTNRFLGLGYTKPIVGVNGSNNGGAKYLVGSTNANEVWFNVWVYGKGKDNSQLAIKFMQDDDLNGEHDGGSENGYEFIIDDVSHYGWKLYSVNYSQLAVGGNLQFGGSGDRIHRPDAIAQIEFSLWSKVNGTPVEVIFDYPIFTLNKPLGQ